jgi:hypothetical protein
MIYATHGYTADGRRVLLPGMFWTWVRQSIARFVKHNIPFPEDKA